MAKRTFRNWRITRFVTGRKRLLLSSMAGLILLPLLPDDLRVVTRLILAWDLTTALYVVSTLWMIGHSTVKTCHDRAALYDEGDWVILLLVVASAAASFVCIALELTVLQSPRRRSSEDDRRPDGRARRCSA